MMRDLSYLRAAALCWSIRGAGEARVDQVLRLLVAAVALLFPGLCLLVDRSDSYSLILLLVIGLIAWARQGFRSRFTPREWCYVAALVAFFAVGVLAYAAGLRTDNGFHLLGRYFRFFLVLPVLIALKRYPPPALVVWTGLGAAALALGVDAVWEHFSATGFLRPDGDTNVAILFGDLATATTFAFAAGYVYVDSRLPRLGPWWMGVCILGGLLACFLSGTRGAWLALPVLLILLLTVRHLLHPRAVLIGAAAIATIFLALCFLPRAHIRDRLTSAYAEIEVYLADGGYGSVPSPKAPVCMQDPASLRVWASLARIQRGHQVQFSLEPFAPSRVRSPCNGNNVLLVRNLTNRRTWLLLPRYERPGDSSTTVRLLVAGSGWIVKNGHRANVRTRPGRYRNISVHGRAGSGVITLGLWPNSRMWIVPVENYPGEFRYTLANTSIGQRLAMWSAAWRLFLQQPLTGVGTGAYMAAARTQVASGNEPSMVASYDHPHNEYLDALSSRGLAGFAALLLLLGVPTWLFGGGLGSHDPVRMGASLAGTMVTVGFAIFGLTETMFVHSITIGWYVIMTAIFMVTAGGGGSRETEAQ